MSRCTGFVRKSTAPAFIARTLEATSACPVRKTTGKLDASSLQGLLELETGGARQAQIEQQAPRPIGHGMQEELARRPVAARLEPGGTEQPQQSGAHRLVVIDDVDQRGGAHAGFGDGASLATAKGNST